MPSSPLGSTHGRTTSGVACHLCLWASRRVGRRRAWHDITSLRQNTWLNDVGCCMASLPLAERTISRRQAWQDITALGQHTRLATSGVAWHHRPWRAHTVGNVVRGMPSPPLDSTHGRMTSGVACHHCPWTTNTVERRRAWHDITILGLHARSDDVGHGMTSPPSNSTHGR